MLLIEAIKSYLAANPVEDGKTRDWDAVAKAMRAITVTAEPRLCFSVETSLAILAVGGNPDEIMTAMDSNATGKFLLTKLATVGLVWAHPLTVAYLDAAVAVNGLGKVSRDAAVQLSAPTSHPHADVTAEDCKLLSLRVALEAIVDSAYQSFVAKFNSAKSGIADGTLTTADQVNGVLT